LRQLRARGELLLRASGRFGIHPGDLLDVRRSRAAKSGFGSSNRPVAA
jgi:hypothetical protein